MRIQRNKQFQSVLYSPTAPGWFPLPSTFYLLPFSRAALGAAAVPEAHDNGSIQGTEKASVHTLTFREALYYSKERHANLTARTPGGNHRVKCLSFGGERTL